MANYVVVLDPGHGSMEFMGGVNGTYIEKDIDLMVSKVIKDYLEQFEGVTVYLTRNEDVNVGLKERCDIAKSYGADFFFSIHFNMDAAHRLYGSEVFLPIQKNYYNTMYPFANEMLTNYESMGFLNRGIKTRLSSNGKDNYYAVIKNCTNYGIPSAIVEHCYLDNINDTQFLSIPGTEGFNNALVNFGYMDAIAIAKTLKLKSTTLGLDYTGYQSVKGNATKALVKNDLTAPETCSIKVINTNKELSNVTLRVSAKDKDSYIVYYQYSVDGGVNFSPLIPWSRTSWNKSVSSMDITVDVPKNSASNIVFAVYNNADLFTLSNAVSVDLINNLNVNLDNEITSKVFDVDTTVVSNDINYGIGSSYIRTGSIEMKSNPVNYTFGLDLCSLGLTIVPLIVVMATLLRRKISTGILNIIKGIK